MSFFGLITRLHTYLLNGSLQLLNRDYDLASHAIYVINVNLYSRVLVPID